MRPSLRTCQICGKEFEGIGTAKYCSRKCKNKAISKQKHENYLAHKALALGKTLEQVKAEDAGNPGSEEVKRSLDAKLGELRVKGQTYAQAQKADTIEKFARIEIPDPFVSSPDEEIIEDPAEDSPVIPAERKKSMYMDSQVREFLAELMGALSVIAANDDVFGGIVEVYVDRISKVLKEEAQK